MRWLFAALLLPSLVLAGCLGDDEPAEPTNAPPPPAVPETFYEVISAISESDAMGEPSLGVTPDGVLFTNGGAGAYRSNDGGATWEFLGEPTAPFPNFDPDLAVDADGTVWFDVLYLACNAVAVSQDQGETWTQHPAVCNGPVGDRQYLVPTQDGTAYLYFHQLPTFYQTAMKTTDFGATWLPTGPVETPDHHLLVNGGSGWGGGGFWNPATDSVFFTFTWFSGTGLEDGKAQPGYSVTHDGGTTWSTGTAADLGGRSLGLGLVVGAADDAGNVYIAWGEAQGDDVGIYLASSADDGATWGTPVRVDDGEGSKVFPAIAAGASGQVAIAYYEADEHTYPSDVDDETNWTVTLAWTRDALAAAPTFERATMSDGVVRQGPICPDGTGCRGDREFLDYFALERMPDGRVAAVFNTLLDDEMRNVFALTRADLLGPRSVPEA